MWNESHVEGTVTDVLRRLGRFDGCLTHQQHPRHYVMLGWNSVGMHHRLQSPALLRLYQQDSLPDVKTPHN